MQYEEVIGFVAGIFTSVSLLPQLIKTIKEKDAKSLSLLMMLVLIAGNSLWIYYGFLQKDFPIIVTNVFSDLVNLSLLFFSVRYKKANSEETDPAILK